MRWESLAISLMYWPVSAAMPNCPSPRPASTSSEVLPARAISKSWMRAAPFMAMPEIFGGENVWECVEEFCERGLRGRGLCKVTDTDFAPARGEWVGVDGAQSDGVDGVDAHGAGDTLPSEEDITKLRARRTGFSCWGAASRPGRDRGCAPTRNRNRGRTITLRCHCCGRCWKCRGRGRGLGRCRIFWCGPRLREGLARRCARRLRRLRGRGR